MNKSELIDRVAANAGLTKAAAAKAVDSVLDAIQGEVAGGGEVAVTGFGRFVAKDRAARTAHNPRKPGEKVKVAATRVPRFIPGKGFRDAVAKK